MAPDSGDRDAIVVAILARSGASAQKERAGCQSGSGPEDPVAVHAPPERAARAVRAMAESSACAVIAGWAFPQIVFAAFGHRFGGLLGGVARAREVAIEP